MPQGGGNPYGGMPQGGGGMGAGAMPDLMAMSNNNPFAKDPIMSKFAHAAEMGAALHMAKSRIHALRALYESTDGEHWSSNKGWNVTVYTNDSKQSASRGQDACIFNLTLGEVEKWDHISCNMETRRPVDEPKLSAQLSIGRPVQALMLAAVGLSGPLPTEIGKLVDNQYLVLSGNKKLVGVVPTQLGQLSKWNYQIDLDHTGVSGFIPTEIGRLEKLNRLRWSGMPLSGTLPKAVGRLGIIEMRLLVGDSHLSGTLPTQVGEWSKLKSLDLAGTRLSGSVPSQLGLLVNAELIVRTKFSNHRLSGTMPTQLALLPKLREPLLESDGKFTSKVVELSEEALKQVAAQRAENEAKEKKRDATRQRLLDEKAKAEAAAAKEAPTSEAKEEL